MHAYSLLYVGARQSTVNIYEVNTDCRLYTFKDCKCWQCISFHLVPIIYSISKYQNLLQRGHLKFFEFATIDSYIVYSQLASVGNSMSFEMCPVPRLPKDQVAAWITHLSSHLTMGYKEIRLWMGLFHTFPSLVYLSVPVDTCGFVKTTQIYMIYTDTPKSGGLIIICRWVSHRGWDSLGYITHFANPFETHENLFTIDYIYTHIYIH